MKDVLIMFGGVSPEHEVSVISGIQIVEHIDRNKYTAHVVFQDKKGQFLYLQGMQTRKDFKKAKRLKIKWSVDEIGGYLAIGGALGKKIYPKAAYLAFHGGAGELGHIQGLLTALQIPVTSPGTEGSVLSMNKEVTKVLSENAGINVVKGTSIISSKFIEDSLESTRKLVKEFGLPLIIKPVHLGSSIGIKVAKTEVELERFLLEAAQIDSEILVEKFLESFVEYNCSIRQINGKLETSEIEKPLSEDEILSFADKYERGGKKIDGGMASLDRELPAKISKELEAEIRLAAEKVFTACRLKGMVRIDFMCTPDKTLYLTEVNPIPGSLSFYLWEASGITFKQQISDLLEQSIKDMVASTSHDFEYETNIIDTFVS